MPSSVKQMYAIAAGVSLLALLGFVFAPHIFAAWVDAPNNPPTYGATGCSPFPCSEEDFKPVTQTTANQSKQGRLAIGTSAAPAYTVDVAGDVNITGSYRINGVSLTQGGGSVLSGAGTANYLSKWTNGTALQDSLVFDNGTNVGIGISSGFNPLVGNKLEVDGAILGRGFFDQNNTDYYLDPASSVSGNLAGTLITGGINTSTLRVRGGTLAPGNVLTSDEFGNATWGQGGYWTLSGTNIYNNNTGNVGIGTATPGAKLEINGALRLTAGGAQYSSIEHVAGNEVTTFKNSATMSNTGWEFNSPTFGTAMKIFITGNVGIGTASPVSKLSVGGAGVAGTGVYGSGTSYGIYGSGTTAGVHGSGTSYGVRGSGTSYGVYGSGGTYGIYGIGGTYAGYFAGNVKVTGKAFIDDITNHLALADATTGAWAWTRVVSSSYAPGPGNHAQYYQTVVLDPNRAVLGIRMSGGSDDGGLCSAGVSGYFGGAVTYNAYVTYLYTNGAFSGSAWNPGAGAFPTTTWIFENTPSGVYLGSVGSYMAQSAYNKAAGLTYIPPGKTLYYHQWYYDGQGGYYNNCYIDVLYGQ